MFETLAHHPFGVEAFFRRSLVLTFALPPELLLPLLGPGLVLDTYPSRSEDRTFGFVAVALVETEGLRPKGLPKWLGRSFFLSGYRIFARFLRPGKAPMRGLKILRSDTDKWAMSKIGNLFTHYNYELSDVTTVATEAHYEVRVKTRTGEGDLHAIADLSKTPRGHNAASRSGVATRRAALRETGDGVRATAVLVRGDTLRRTDTYQVLEIVAPAFVPGEVAAESAIEVAA